MITLTDEQELEVRVLLCHYDYCLRCNFSIPDARDRFLATIPYNTKKHQYVNCFVVCSICYQDEKGTLRWLQELDEQESLYIAKERAAYIVTVK